MGRRRKYTDSRTIPKTASPPHGTEVLSSKGTFSKAEALVWITLAILFAISLATFHYPIVRAFYRGEINVNEGWNAYNAQAVMQHRPLYPAKHSWIQVGYPLLSFYIVGYVSHFIGDYQLTGRLISLIAFLVSCVLVGLIAKKLTGGWGPAVFASAFCLGLSCSRMPDYVGMDDPQMLAHPFFLFGLWVYMQAVPSTLRIAGLTSIFILGGNIKHSLFGAPISVLSDLFTTSRGKAVRFMVFGVLFLALSIAVTTLVGGPFFVSNALLGQPYSFERMRNTFFLVYIPLELPLAISAFWSISQLQNRQARVISFYYFSSLLVGLLWAGGMGVNTNTFFDNLFAMSIIMGACLDSLWKAPIPSLGKGGRWRFLVPVLLYSTVVMAYVPQALKRPKLLSDLPVRQRLFDAEVSFLVAQPGPAICESLVMCYAAGEPHIIDPFTFRKLEKLGIENSSALVQQIAEKKYGAIQTYLPVTQRPYIPPEVGDSYPDEVLDAIDHYYVEALEYPGCHIYVPRVEPKGPSNPQ